MFDEMVRPHQDGRQHVPSPDGPWDYYRRYEPGRAAPAARPPPARAGEPASRCCSTSPRWRRAHAYFASRPRRAQRGPPPYACAEDRQGSEDYAVRVMDLATRARWALRSRAAPATSPFRRCGLAVLDAARRQRPPVRHLPPAGRRQRGRRRAGLPRGRSRLLPRRRQHHFAGLDRHHRRQPGDQRGLARSRRTRPRRRRAWSPPAATACATASATGATGSSSAPTRTARRTTSWSPPRSTTPPPGATWCRTRPGASSSATP